MEIKVWSLKYLVCVLSCARDKKIKEAQLCLEGMYVCVCDTIQFIILTNSHFVHVCNYHFMIIFVIANNDPISCILGPAFSNIGSCTGKSNTLLEIHERLARYVNISLIPMWSMRVWIFGNETDLSLFLYLEKRLEVMRLLMNLIQDSDYYY